MRRTVSAKVIPAFLCATLVAASPLLAEAISSGLDKKLPLAAYEVVLSADGERLEWLERTPQGDVRHTTEPQTGFPQAARRRFHVAAAHRGAAVTGVSA